LEVQVLDVEKFLPAPSYTVQTLEHLSKQYPLKHFGFVMGLDQLGKFPSWLEPLKILEMASLILIPRDNLDFKTAFLEMSQNLGISVDRIKDFHVEFEEYRTAYFIAQATTPTSSTELRELLNSGKDRSSDIDREVLRYIVSKHLYSGK
jgi:nicotinate (nicotinamide) nucleotide adenylyltransferase